MTHQDGNGIDSEKKGMCSKDLYVFQNVRVLTADV